MLGVGLLERANQCHKIHLEDRIEQDMLFGRREFFIRDAIHEFHNFVSIIFGTFALSQSVAKAKELGNVILKGGILLRTVETQRGQFRRSRQVADIEREVAKRS